ncbi:uncharacterized protein C8R40DRAFT_1216195 [Lentinula edodes]|uniref:uncharacterized protein n=1 Tax=Lentinula edodes TaxID=5353 RepID=UPI001E8EE3A4|nr:uncharacterized protein C8R40DRAFT_1216195 [Lentinula edodes]KAH7869580.1 hypothetical protein C8R40DRAFT_1216195 [Lentinula edodes]
MRGKLVPDFPEVVFLMSQECLVQARAAACRLYRNVKHCFKDSNSNFHNYIGLMFIGIALSERKSNSAFTQLNCSEFVLTIVIVMLRTYAVWGRKRSMLLFLIVLTVVVFIVPTIVFTELAVNSLQLLAALITIQAYKHLRQTRSPWVTKLYKDGIIFYFSLLDFFI